MLQNIGNNQDLIEPNPHPLHQNEAHLATSTEPRSLTNALNGRNQEIASLIQNDTTSPCTTTERFETFKYIPTSSP